MYFAEDGHELANSCLSQRLMNRSGVGVLAPRDPSVSLLHLFSFCAHGAFSGSHEIFSKLKVPSPEHLWCPCKAPLAMAQNPLHLRC